MKDLGHLNFGSCGSMDISSPDSLISSPTISSPSISISNTSVSSLQGSLYSEGNNIIYLFDTSCTCSVRRCPWSFENAFLRFWRKKCEFKFFSLCFPPPLLKNIQPIWSSRFAAGIAYKLIYEQRALLNTFRTNRLFQIELESNCCFDLKITPILTFIHRY